MRTPDFWLCVVFLDGEEYGELPVAVSADEFVCRHDGPLSEAGIVEHIKILSQKPRNIYSDAGDGCRKKGERRCPGNDDRENAGTEIIGSL
jgi:hypothetical protein